MELKKLVYLYLINYAKTNPDMAIMAVNTFVKVCRERAFKIRHLPPLTAPCPHRTVVLSEKAANCTRFWPFCVVLFLDECVFACSHTCNHVELLGLFVCRTRATPAR